MPEFNYQFDDLFNPVLEALHKLGGSGTNQEIEEEVIAILNLGQEEMNDLHRGATTKLHYRLRWARNYLKNYGLLENPSRAVWALTPDGLSTRTVEKKEVNRFVRAKNRSKEDNAANGGREPVEDEGSDELVWQDQLLDVLKSLSPSGLDWRVEQTEKRRSSRSSLRPRSRTAVSCASRMQPSTSAARPR